METYAGVQIDLFFKFLTSTLDGAEWSASYIDYLTEEGTDFCIAGLFRPSQRASVFHKIWFACGQNIVQYTV